MIHEVTAATKNELPNNRVLETASPNKDSVRFFLSSPIGLSIAISTGIVLNIAIIDMSIVINCSVKENPEQVLIVVAAFHYL